VASGATNRCCWPSYRNQGNAHRIVQKALQGVSGALGQLT